MIVSLDPAGALTLEEPQNLKAFSFRAGPTPPGGASEAVTFRAGFAWVSEAHLRRWPPLARDQDWQAALGVMVTFARRKGWVDPATGRIRAHIEA